jgi:hypothetical protein
VQNRPINMFIIGYPTPPATPAAIAATFPPLINCNVHGNEPGDREGCLILARRLAFSNDVRTLDLLSHTTVLIVPTINGDGRAADTRGNSTGQDLNRDYSLIRQPETFAFVRMLREYRPVAGFDGHEFGNNGAGDLPMLPPRHQNVAQSIFDQSQDMIVGHMYEQGAKDGWWPCPYGCANGGNVGLSEETILRNALGLKNVINSLLEPKAQNLLVHLDVQPVPRLPPGRATGDPPSPTDGHRLSGGEHRPDRVPGFPPDSGVPSAASG